MKFADLIKEIYYALTANKSRSALTILGIVIGIGSVIAMISVGQGTKNTIEASIQSLGSNLILVTPGAQRGIGMQVSQGRGSAQTLANDDATAIGNNISGISAVAPEISGRYQVTTKGKNTNVSVDGVTAAYSTVRNVEIDSGYFITDQNVSSAVKVAVLGPTARDDLFGAGVDAIGQIVRIKSMEFKVIGITKTKGGGGFGSQDEMIYVPLTTAQKFLAGNDKLSTINVQATDQKNMTDIQSQITTLLLARHKISDPTKADFSTMNQADIVATATSMAGTFTILLGSIAAISLLVGGIGIMNMMLTSVTERTREIGLRKAIGAKKKDVSIQFLSEAIVLTFLGGIFGVILGWLISLGIAKFGSLTTSVSLPSILLAFGVSAAIGVIFGYYPARRAAGLNPIEALRYE